MNAYVDYDGRSYGNQHNADRYKVTVEKQAGKIVLTFEFEDTVWANLDSYDSIASVKSSRLVLPVEVAQKMAGMLAAVASGAEFGLPSQKAAMVVSEKKKT